MRGREDTPKPQVDWVPWAVASAYALVYSYLGAIRYLTYHAGCDDGLFVQSISSVFHGFHNTPEGASHFAYHFSPILYLLAPLIWIWKSALVLIITQAIAGALTVPPIYAIARRRLPPLPAALVGVIAGLYPPLGGIAFSDFSENAFAPAAAAWLIWAIDSRRMPASICFALICLSIKEDQAVVMAALGVTGAVYFYRAMGSVLPRPRGAIHSYAYRVSRSGSSGDRRVVRIPFNSRFLRRTEPIVAAATPVYCSEDGLRLRHTDTVTWPLLALALHASGDSWATRMPALSRTDHVHGGRTLCGDMGSVRARLFRARCCGSLA